MEGGLGSFIGPASKDWWSWEDYSALIIIGDASSGEGFLVAILVGISQPALQGLKLGFEGSLVFEIDEQLASLYNETKGLGKIVAVGTTVVRALESSLDEKGKLQSCRSSTGIFIYPGRKVRSIDALITNFHLPRSTLLMLVQAFAGRDIKPIYAAAMMKQYLALIILIISR